MSRYAGLVADVPEWVSVSLERPCPVCGASTECTILEDDVFARCVNVVCERPVLTGGWLHRLSDLDERTLGPI